VVVEAVVLPSPAYVQIAFAPFGKIAPSKNKLVSAIIYLNLMFSY
jgi:hypothetical protein